jgi:flagellar motor switch protein FliN/FliY
MSSSLSSLSSTDPAGGGDAFAPLHDVTCRVDVVLGSATMSVRDCLGLQRDSLIRLAQSAGNDLQVVINGIAVAQGEVVIIDNSTAVRITDILAPPSNEASS